MTELSVSQSDPEVSGDITGGKITCLWQTDDEQNKNPGLLSLRPDPFFFFLLIPSVILKKPITVEKHFNKQREIIMS